MCAQIQLDTFTNGSITENEPFTEERRSNERCQNPDK